MGLLVKLMTWSTNLSAAASQMLWTAKKSFGKLVNLLMGKGWGHKNYFTVYEFLARPKWVSCMTFHCEECRDENFNWGDDRFGVIQSEEGADKDRLIFKQSMCRKCVLMNMDICDLFFKFADKNYPDYSDFELKMRREKNEKAAGKK
jgi:hypothetical protein